MNFSRWGVDFLRDLQYGFRVMRRSPLFALVAIGSLAIGIGGAASVFTVLNAVVLRSLPVPNPQQIFAAEHRRTTESSPRFSWPAIQAARQAVEGRATIAASTGASGLQLRRGGSATTVPAERGLVQMVSGEYFDVLGQRPQLGRLLAPSDNQTVNAHPVAVISDAFWERQFRRSPSAAGSELIINGASFTPRSDAAADFISEQAHSIDALLRYKENESKVASAGKDKQQGVEVYVIDLTDKANRKTRYFISAKTFRILWLEYEETPPGSTTAIKYSKRFYDYRVAQGTLVPFRVVLFEDGKQIVETRILTVQYGLKMEDSLFQNPEAATSSSNP